MNEDLLKFIQMAESYAIGMQVKAAWNGMTTDIAREQLSQAAKQCGRAMMAMEASRTGAMKALTKDSAKFVEKVYHCSVVNPERFRDVWIEAYPEILVGEIVEDEVDAKKREAIQWWNDGKTWPQVNAQLMRDPSEAKATEMELKRFADKNFIEIRKGKPGKKRGS